MQSYDKGLKTFSRALRSNMTEAEQHLWRRIRSKQLADVQFYRQKSLLSYIVDFYCPRAKLVIELDGGQHFEPDGHAKDQMRDVQLDKVGIKVLRFDNRQVLIETEAVMTVIYDVVMAD